MQEQQKEEAMNGQGASAASFRNEAIKLLEQGSDIKREVADPTLAAADREKAQVLALLAIHDVLSDLLQEYIRVNP